MKIEIACKSSEDSSWIISKFRLDEKLYDWLIKEFLRVQSRDRNIYYKKYYAFKISSSDKIYHFFLTDKGNSEVRRILEELIERLRDDMNLIG